MCVCVCVCVCVVFPLKYRIWGNKLDATGPLVFNLLSPGGTFLVQKMSIIFVCPSFMW